jgi:hypothetical protein
MLGRQGRQEKSMAVQGPIPVEFGHVFPRGVFAAGGFEPVRDFEASKAGRFVQSKDKVTGPPAVGRGCDRRRSFGAGQDGAGERQRAASGGVWLHVIELSPATNPLVSNGLGW